jgi:two-component system sensor histidine kinase KdpD
VALILGLLTHRIRERDKQTLSEKYHAVTLKSVSHEFKTPLTSLLGNLQLLRHSSPSPLIDDCESAALRLKRLVDNLLDISRLSAGKVPFVEEWIDLQEWIDTGISSLFYEDKKRLFVHLPKTPIYIRGDIVLLERLFIIIFENALAYSKPDSPIIIHCETSPTHVSLMVDNKGPQIPPEYVAQIFETFFRVPGTQPGGTGLGLAIAKQIMELHHGKISLDSTVLITRVTLLFKRGTPCH